MVESDSLSTSTIVGCFTFDGDGCTTGRIDGDGDGELWLTGDMYAGIVPDFTDVNGATFLFKQSCENCGYDMYIKNTNCICMYINTNNRAAEAGQNTPKGKFI